ncbi:MAG: hypothetical protein OXB97_04465 [Rhodospirillales bacterium]|nr:hypothetical protein [Rhodospirillales bacterium]
MKLRIPIFRTGRWAPAALDDAAVRSCAQLYDSASDPAPLVIGHPRTDHPSFGWVEALEFDDAGVLHGTIRDVDPEVKKIVDEGKYRRVSASFWRPDARSNPHPGKFALRHVGLLGAAAPGCPGLGAVAFEADDDYLTVQFDAKPWTWRSVASLFSGVRDWIIENNDIETADRILPEYEIETVRDAASEDERFSAPAPTPTETTPTGDEMDEQELAARAAAIEQREAAIDAREAETRRESAVSFADAQADAGRVLPREAGPLADVLAALEEHSATVDFADADEPGQAAKWLRDFVSALPARVPQGESAPGADAPHGGSVVSFAAPAGRKADADRLRLHEDATAHAAEHGVSYIDAVRAVQRRAS